jgi:molybdopterin molybdotransferase
VKPEQNLLRQAREMRRGDTILTAGALVRPQEIGLLATVGKTLVPVYPRPTVGIISTGDEVVEPDVVPGPGQIRNSNAYLLYGQVARAGANPVYLGIAGDDPASLELIIKKSLRHDVVLLTGGVSAGNKDYVPAVLAKLGVEAVFHKVKMKPGKPLFFGTTPGTLTFGLPGNPVSALVGFELFVRPALRLAMGHAQIGPVLRAARLTRSFVLKGDRTTYHPGQLVATDDDGWHVTPVPWFGSPDLRAVGQSNAFIVFEVGKEHYDQGDQVQVLDPE